MKKIFALLMALVLISGLTAGCQKKAEEVDTTTDVAVTTEKAAEATTEAVEAKKVVVNLWELTEFKTITDLLIEEYKAVQPNVEIVANYSEIDAHKNNLKVAASSGEMPDVWFTWGGSLGGFYPENNLTKDLTQRAASEGWDQIYMPAMLEMCTYGGKLSGVPRQSNSMGMFYRKDIFDKLNLTVPTTIAEFEATLDALKADGVTPIAAGGKNGWQLMRTVEGIMEGVAGSDLHDKLMQMEESWDQPIVVETYQKYKSWVDKGYFPQDFITLDPNEAIFLLYTGEAAMALEGPWFDSQLGANYPEGNKEDYGFFPLPTDQSKVRLSSFTEMYQFNNSSSDEVYEAALAFVRFAESKETIEKLQASFNFPKAVIGAVVPDTTPHVKDILAAVNAGGSYLVADQALPQELIAKLFETQDAIVIGTMTPEEASKFMQDEIEKYKAAQ
ncbi:MAG: carbohydrate ABC transporter substrate-binding protein [Vallitaleaceae bacterium]|nr:carbohydrate ABC transporter substrate-binding protein [Vallitaleaceae bacterium]